jgi:hypothetical protein
MASSGCRARASLPLLLFALAAVAGCGGRAVAPVNALPPLDPGIELPAGQGREILLARCLGCHNLGGLELFDDFYTREDWHQLLETMVAHGAAIDAEELEVVADYLGLNYSRQP